MKTLVIYEVALTGFQQNYFTLYRTFISSSTDFKPSRRYVKNLSIDFSEAVLKAREISGDDETTETYEKKLVCSEEEAQKITALHTSKAIAESEGTITFGKYKYEKIEDVFLKDKKYITWIAKGGYLKESNSENWYPSIGLENTLRQSAIALLIGSGDWIERKGEFMPVEKAEKLDEKEANTGHFFNNGERITIEITLESTSSFDGSYGTTFIQIYKSEGKYFKYMGTTPLNFEGSVTVKATVKHTEYKGQKETQLQRIKLYSL